MTRFVFQSILRLAAAGSSYCDGTARAGPLQLWQEGVGRPSI